MQEGIEENKLNKENKKARKESRLAKALAKDDARTGFVPSSKTVEDVNTQEQPKTQTEPQSIVSATPTDAAPTKVTNELPEPVKKAGTAVLNAISTDNSLSLNDYIEGAKTAVVASKEEDKQNNQAIKDAVTVSKQIEKAPEVPEEASLIEQSTPLAGSGGTVKNVVSANQGQRPTAEQYYTKEDIQREIANAYSDRVDNSADLAIEKIGLEDYYPNIGKDIAVGSYSGKYIGSTTIFAAPGARLPLGLMDARKRALAKAAESKQAALDKIATLPDTSAQFDTRFKDLKYNELHGFLEKANYDAEALSRDPEFMKWSYNTSSKAKEIINANAWADQIVLDSQDKAKYTPQESLDLAYKIKSGQVDDFESFISGEDKNFTSILDGAKTYLNALPEIQKAAEFMLKPENMSQGAINLRTGGVYDSEKFIAERNQFLQEVQDPNMATDTYVTGIRKFFGGDYEKLVDNIIASGNYNKDQAEPLKKIVASMIQKQDILTFKTSNNGAVEMAKLAQRQKEFEYKKEQDANSLWGSINGQMTDAVSRETGKSFQQEIAELEKKGLTGAALEKQTSMIAAKYFPGANVSVGYSADGKKKIVKSFIPATDAAGKLTPKPVYNADGTPARQMNVEVFWGGKWVKKMLTPTQIAAQKNVRIVGKTTPLTREQKQAYGDVSSGGLYTKVVGTEAIPAYYDSKGDMHYLDPSNEYSVHMYNASANKFTMTRDVEKAYVRERVQDQTTKEWVEKDVELEGTIYSNATNLSVSGSAATKDLQYGYKIDKAADIYGGEGDFGTSIEASGSSTTE